MKLKILTGIFTLSLLTTGSVLGAPTSTKSLKSNQTAPSSRLAPGQEPTAEQQKYLETYGYVVGRQATGQLGLNASELKYLNNGFMKGVLNGEPPVALDTPSDGMQQYLAAKAEAFQKVRATELKEQGIENRKKAAVYYAKLDKDSKVKKTASGLYYEITKTSQGVKPTETSTVTIDYVGSLLLDGTVFDSSKARGQAATLNLDQVIPGFKEGLQYIGKGGSIRLTIRPELAYEDNEIAGIPPGSTLVFDVDMIDVVETQAQPNAT